MNKLHGKDLKAYQDVDLDDLLSKLTDAELEELHTELIDPDVSFNSVNSLFSYFMERQVLIYLKLSCWGL